jgi:hypothetical protein
MKVGCSNVAFVCEFKWLLSEYCQNGAGRFDYYTALPELVTTCAHFLSLHYLLQKY